MISADLGPQLETFVTSTVGKGVVRAKDTPNFIANRIGIAGIDRAQHRGRRRDAAEDVEGGNGGTGCAGDGARHRHQTRHRRAGRCRGATHA